MRRLSDFRGEEALDVMADIMVPASEIMTDKDFVELVRASEKQTTKDGKLKFRMEAISLAIKAHKNAVLRIMARLEDVPVETYNPSLITLPMMLLNLFNDPELKSLFSLQGQTEAQTNSGSATEITEAHAG